MQHWKVQASRAQRPVRRLRRGTTLVEVLLGASMMFLIGLATIGFNSFTANSYAGAARSTDAHRKAEIAVQRMARDLREARSVASTSNFSANPPVLALQMPLADNTGLYVVPVADGNIVTYTLSSDLHSLTRTENGVTQKVLRCGSDTQLQLTLATVTEDLNANGVVDAGEYVSVTPSIAATTTPTSGSAAWAGRFTASQEALLRNR
jgi:hypothetical protein